MKKFLLVVVAAMMATSVFAQDWSVGGRVGAGVQALGQYYYNGSDQIEARIGLSFVGITADFTVLHNWHILDMDWTPSAGKWFFDAGAGINVGGAAHYAYVGVAGMARLGFTFNKIPLTLGVDYTPSIGPEIGYWKGGANAAFNVSGFFNGAITATYNF